jgi:hypothetical protein
MLSWSRLWPANPHFFFFIIRNSLPAPCKANRARARAAGRRGRRTNWRPRWRCAHAHNPCRKTTDGTSSPAFSAANFILHAQQEETWCQSVLIGYVGGLRGDEKRRAHGFLKKEMARPMARAPWLIIEKNSSSGPTRQLPLFFLFL